MLSHEEFAVIGTILCQHHYLKCRYTCTKNALLEIRYREDSNVIY